MAVCLTIYCNVKGELKGEVIKVILIHHLYSLITIHDDFHNADPSSIAGHLSYTNSVK